ncbi:MAG: hypothetical protein HeimC3_32620 [Candidatus Heimdallarchaeota archaeon LC_3]|nr:MAG: hypothetical protein HeimC3_32620 [Candidatus Heimdallarchaeota archaeon LC_3]
MKVALDTSYFMFGFNLSPKQSIPQNCLDIISQNKEIDEIIYSDLVIFELNAKSSKLLPNCSDLNEKTNLLVELDKLKKFKLIRSINESVWELACFLRQYHKDFVDCVHWAVSINESVDIFLTEDENIIKLTEKKEFRNDYQKRKFKSLVEVKNFKQFKEEL